MSEEKTVLLSIKLDTGDLKKNSEEASKKLEELKTKQAILRGENKQGTVEYAKLSAEIKAQNQILTQSSKAIEINDRLGNKQNLTLKEQAELLSAGKVALRNLTAEEIANTDSGRQLNKEVSDLNESLKKSEKAYGDNQREVGNYDKGIQGLKAELKALKSQMVGLDAGSEEYQQASEKAGQLGDKIKEVNENVKASSGGTGFEKLSNNLGLVKDDLMNLDFAGVSEKMKQMAVISKGMTFKEVIGGLKNMGSALFSLGKAILMNPLFLMVGVIAGVVGALKMWSDYTSEQAVKAQEKHTEAIQKNIDKMIAQNKKREEISALELKLLELDGAGAKKIADKKTKDLYQSEAERLDLIKKYKLKGKDLSREFDLADSVESKNAVNEKIRSNNALLTELGNSFTGYKEKRLILEKENNKDIREENKTASEKRLADQQIANQKTIDAEQKRLDFLYKLADLQLANEDKANANSYKRAEIKYTAMLNDANNSAQDLLQIQKDYNAELDAIDKEAQADDIAKLDEAKKREIKSAEGNAQLLKEIDRKYVLEKTAVNKDYENKKKERDAKSITDTDLFNKAKVNSEKKATQEIKLITAELNYLKSKGTIDEQKAFEQFQQAKIDILTENAQKEIELNKFVGAEKLAVEKKLELDINNIKTESTDKTTEKTLSDKEKEAQQVTTIALNSAVQLTDAISQVQQSQIQKELTDVENKYKDQNDLLKQQLDAELISQAEYDSKKSVMDAEFKATESKLKKEAFEKEKAANIIKAIMNTAVSVTALLLNPPMAILAGTLGAVQVGLIASQPTPKFAKGGVFGGNSHANGGTKGYFEDGTQIEVEKDENFYILNKNASRHINGLSNLNQQFGGIPLMANGGAVTSSGIMATSITNGVDANLNAQNQMMRMIEMMPKPVVIVQDINDAQGNLATVENRANF